MLKIEVNFTHIPLRTQAYYDWLVTGLGIMQQKGQLEISFRDGWIEKLMRANPRIYPRLLKHTRRLAEMLSPIDYVCLTGKVVSGDKCVSFAFDIQDSPFNYAMGLLETVDLYFKCQCPAKFEPEGFPLTQQLRIPYHPDVFTFAQKIRPAMLGRPLGQTLNLRKNLRVLKQWENARAVGKSMRIFASFGSDVGLRPRTSESPLPAPHNYESESSLLARWGNKVHHPNYKRAELVRILRKWQRPDIDARVWRTEAPDIYGPLLSPQEYQSALARTMVNVNVSGFRRSIPYRFMDTLLTGGSIASDSLAVRWYHDFEPDLEVYDLGLLGYEPEANVDWKKIEERLLEVYEKNPPSPERSRAVLDLYQKKWAPEVFASYVIQECLKVMESR